jgi:hypothetical protein
VRSLSARPLWRGQCARSRRATTPSPSTTGSASRSLTLDGRKSDRQLEESSRRESSCHASTTAAFVVAGFNAGQPTDVTISGTPAQYIELEPAGAQEASSVTIDGQTIALEPDRRYRFTLAKIPMDQEAATVIIVTEAPVEMFPTFVTVADRLFQTVKL